MKNPRGERLKTWLFDSEEAGQNNETAVDANADLRGFLKGLGIRTATDLLDCQDEIAKYNEDAGNAKLIKKLKIIIASLRDDEWLNYVDSWRDNSSTEKKEPIADPYKFYFRVTGTKDPTRSSHRMEQALARQAVLPRLTLNPQPRQLQVRRPMRAWLVVHLLDLLPMMCKRVPAHSPMGDRNPLRGDCPACDAGIP